MIFHTTQRSIIYLDLTINNTLIEKVKSFNCLGLTLSDILKIAHTHIINVSRTISKYISVINVLRYYMVLKTMHAQKGSSGFHRTMRFGRVWGKQWPL